MGLKRCFLLSLVLALAAVGLAQQDPVSTIKRDLAGWREIMEMFVMDDGHYPEISSMEALAYEVLTRQYAEQVVAGDPTGRPYRVSSTRNHYRISTADDFASIENGFKEPEVKAPPKPPMSPPALSFPAPRSPDTTLYVTKSGNDIRLDWTGTGTQYDGTMGTGPQFASVRTLFIDSTASSYLYTNGLLKTNETFLCFDVTDEVEQNHGGYWNGGLLPPPPPTIDAGSPSTTIGSLYVGSTGTIVGTGFSTNVPENTICFDGGVCTPATTATATQVQFTTPPGAVSGNLSVRVGSQSSDPATAFVTLEDPAVGWNIRTIGYSHLTGEYWMAGNGPAGQSIYRVYFDPGTKKWLKSDQKGGMSAQSIVCSGHTSRTGRLFCGYWTTSTSGGTRYVDTSPVGTLTGCTGLPGSGANSINIRGVAVDPNPDGVAGRDVAYFAHADGGNSTYTIRRLSSTACYSPPPTNDPQYDSNYGNYNWNGQWNPIVGMTVDPVNGDLYIGTITSVYKIDTSETITAVKGGFTTIYDLDLFRQSPGDPGFLLVADAGTLGAGFLKAFALDNTAAVPLTVSSVASMRAATWGGIVFSQAAVNGGNAIRRAVLHNNGNSGAVCPVRDNPFIQVYPEGDAELWISAPSPEYGWGQGPSGQAYVRPSDPAGADYSLGRVTMAYKDGVARQTCAFIGDPESFAAYEPDPANPDDCDKPREKVSGDCDNVDPLLASFTGAFTDSLGLHSCKTCGGATPCTWDFQITRNDAGDNYKVYFQTADSPSQNFFADASPVFTAWKHVHVEHDQTCRRGGILAQDFNGAACVPWTGIDPLCEAVPDPANLKCNELRVFDWVNFQAGDQIKLFDSSVPYETTTQTAIYNSSINLGDGTSIICLRDAGGNGVNLQGQFIASASGPPNARIIDFSLGKSAGVCTDSGGFYFADPSDLRQPFNDASVGFHYPALGTEGAGVVPYLPPAFFDGFEIDGSCANIKSKAGFTGINWFRFGNIWFQNKAKYNYLEVVGLGNTTQLDTCTVCDVPWPSAPKPQLFGLAGIGYANADGLSNRISLVFRGAIEYPCQAASWDNETRHTTAHEIGHQFYVNMPAFASGMHDDHCTWIATGAGCSPLGTCVGCYNSCCIMNISGNGWDGIDRFDYEDLFCGDPLCPNGKAGCCPACSLPGNGSIRQLNDPLRGTQP